MSHYPPNCIHGAQNNHPYFCDCPHKEDHFMTRPAQLCKCPERNYENGSLTAKEEKKCPNGCDENHICSKCRPEEEKCSMHCYEKDSNKPHNHPCCDCGEPWVENKSGKDETISSPTWEEKEREAFYKFTDNCRGGRIQDYDAQIADYWIERMKAVREEGYKEGRKETVHVVDKNFTDYMKSTEGSRG